MSQAELAQIMAALERFGEKQEKLAAQVSSPLLPLYCRPRYQSRLSSLLT